jgi:Uncharacterized conserved protein
MAKAFEIPGFDPNGPLDECISLIIRARTAEIESFKQGLLAGTVEAVHDMRVSCRRLETVLAIFQDSLKKGAYKKFRKKLRLLIRRLGKTRQFDVVMETVSPYLATTNARQVMVANLFMARFRAKRFMALQKTRGAFRKFGTDPLYKQCISPACDVDCPSPIKNRQRGNNAVFPLIMREFISKLLDDFLSGAERALKNDDDPAALHAMRIRGKPLRYAMELAQPFLKIGFTAHYLEIKNMIEELGTIHDNDVACCALRSFDKELGFFNSMTLTPENRLPRTVLLRARKSLEIDRKNRCEKVRIIQQNWHNSHFSETVGASLALARWRRKAAHKKTLTKIIPTE